MQATPPAQDASSAPYLSVRSRAAGPRPPAHLRARPADRPPAPTSRLRRPRPVRPRTAGHPGRRHRRRSDPPLRRRTTRTPPHVHRIHQHPGPTHRAHRSSTSIVGKRPRRSSTRARNPHSTGGHTKDDQGNSTAGATGRPAAFHPGSARAPRDWSRRKVHLPAVLRRPPPPARGASTKRHPGGRRAASGPSDGAAGRRSFCSGRVRALTHRVSTACHHAALGAGPQARARRGGRSTLACPDDTPPTATLRFAGRGRRSPRRGPGSGGGGIRSERSTAGFTAAFRLRASVRRHGPSATGGA